MSRKGRAVIPIIVAQTRPSWQHGNGQVASISSSPAMQQLDQLKFKYNVFSSNFEDPSVDQTLSLKAKHFPCCSNRNREHKIDNVLILLC